MTTLRTPLRLLAGAAFLSAITLTATAQTPEPQKPAVTAAPATTVGPHDPSRRMTVASVHTFYLKNATSQQEQNEILTGLRNIVDPTTRLFLSPAQNAIVAGGTDDQVALAQSIIEALDRPRKTYRLTYTLIDFDGMKRVGDQHYSTVAVPGQHVSLKQGNKVPIITGSYLKGEPNMQENQVTYLDVGMDFDVTLDDSADTLRLKTKVSQSSVVEDRTVAAAMQDPILRQSVFEGSAAPMLGKPLTIGSLDIIGTTRRIEIQVLVEPIS
ncbi:MAG: hypothetical protein PW789_19010 [Edaphobacter sp.]|uniref:secretin N-terminal domain-containing protein n=1 Tax=Edaphobacter sp. TaxID=1934404 RepID=UPI00238D6AFC|nr:secretin N-terminal domain-containing protein [Edaphobacter sp.]MDE1178670.1 hypothetical protein [Edaphobacter sp.]